MTMKVTLNGTSTEIDRAVFEALLDNSVVRAYAKYLNARSAGRIAFADLLELARKAQIPYPLFFSPLNVATAQVDIKTEKLLQGVKKETFSLNSRASVALADVELIIKDLVRKQELVKRFDPSLPNNPIVGLLSKRAGSPAENADRLLEALDLTSDDIRTTKNKSAAVDLLVAHLEAHQILVARSVNGYMPQTITKVRSFSGLTVKDSKVPYVFLAGGMRGEDEEPEGRQVFTLALLAVLIARRLFAPVIVKSRNIKIAPPWEYEIVAEMLMPQSHLREFPMASLVEIEAAAADMKVTPSAIVVRASQLELIERNDADRHLADLVKAFKSRPASQARSPLPVNAIRKYNGREFSIRMIDALDRGKMNEKTFCQVATGNKLSPADLANFRAALR